MSTLPSGTVVSEVSLAQDLRISRTPVHQALARLAKEGLIEHRAGIASHRQRPLG